MPNFLVIGAAKCGTDSLCNYLGQHPDIFMCPNREPNFFAAEGQPDIPYCGPGDRVALGDMWVSTLDAYQSLFSGVTTEKAIGEGTAWYIYYQDVPVRIQRHVPDVKLIAVLRNPIDRAYSAYTMLLHHGRETIADFARALAAEEDRTRHNWEPIWHYVKMGFYTNQLNRYYEVFDTAQIRVIIYDDFNTNPLEITSGLYDFLNVDNTFKPDTATRHNVSKVPKNMAIHTMVAGQHPAKAALKAVLPYGLRRAVKNHVVERNLARPPSMQPGVRRQLTEIFRADILELQNMTGRDLSHWLAE